MLVLRLISQIIKIQLWADLNLRKTPQLVELVDDSKDVEELMNQPPEKILLRWMNFHLTFSADVKDVEELMNQPPEKILLRWMNFHLTFSADVKYQL
uniref:Calponin-homology (CH) domain-containing protein n=1 Tax=Nelumbo nucifera TaxID=4432 RepID=A0A822ZQL5_NELNU|nr:TPA_asm: hypothetical protein HUJ06_004031 [Nelumbo nucifera]